MSHQDSDRVTAPRRCCLYDAVCVSPDECDEWSLACGVSVCCSGDVVHAQLHEIEIGEDTLAKLEAAAAAAGTTPDAIVEQALAVELTALDVVATQRDEAVAALADLLAAWPDLASGHSTSEQQAALRRARAVLQRSAA